MGNFSRDTFKINELKHYAGVRLQQGVPLVDADWNEMEDIRKFEFQDVLKWFVGNGIPKGNDGFHILPVTISASTSDDFLIKGGDGTVKGAGRCLVDGQEVMINEDMNYKDQPLYENDDLAKEWDVDPLGPLDLPPATGKRRDWVYLDVWEREVNAEEDKDLVNQTIGIETCVRIKREWVVRVKTGGHMPAPPQGHVFYLLAVLVHHQGESAIYKIEDKRTTNVSLIDEIMDARGIKGNLGNRLDESLTKGGQLRHSVVREDQLDTAVKGKLVTNGNNHDHIRGDGATIRHSSLNKDDGTNPHGTTAVNVGALPVSDGKVQLGGGSGNAVATFIQSQTGTDIHAGLISGYGFGSIGLGTRSALVGFSTNSEAYGVYAQSSGTYSLYVTGTSFFSGAKTGYVVDIFVNGSGQRLRTGDVVKLKGTPVTRFQGDNNKIPVTEVTLADKENEKMIIGIVDCESIPEQGSPDNRVGPDDPTFIEDGSELFVVTLGAYANCKVDATESPVEVGDLLTSSSNPGHAMKATDPKIGSIIGKALEPLKEGTGYISAFINIQ